MAKKQELRLRKIPLEQFLDALLELYNKGLDYIDLVGTPDSVQDTIGIMFTKDYMNKEMREFYDEANNEDEELSKKIDLSNDDDINQLI